MERRSTSQARGAPTPAASLPPSTRPFRWRATGAAAEPTTALIRPRLFLSLFFFVAFHDPMSTSRQHQNRQHQGHLARKRFGQNFLVDLAVIDSIVEAIRPLRGQRM